MLGILLTLAALVMGQASSEQQVVGTWKFATATLKIEWSAKAKAYAKDPKTAAQAKTSMANAKAGIANLFATYRWTFKPNHTFVLAGKDAKQKKTGTWSLYGSNLRVVMTNAGEKVPELSVDKGGKRIRATLKEPEIGTATVDLVKG